MNAATRMFFGALLRTTLGAAAGTACSLSIVVLWPRPARFAVVETVSVAVVWVGVFAGYAWGQAYLARVRRQ